MVEGEEFLANAIIIYRAESIWLNAPGEAEQKVVEFLLAQPVMLSSRRKS